jgi:hypothetical protein
VSGFEEDVNRAVAGFLADPKVAPEQESILDDPELAAAALEGIAANPVARTYQSGYAAGEAAGRVAALAELANWISERYAGFATGSLRSSDVLTEIGRRVERYERRSKR